MERREHRYEFNPSDMEELVFYLMDQSKAFRDIAKIIGYRYPELNFFTEICDRLAGVCDNLGKYIESRK